MQKLYKVQYTFNGYGSVIIKAKSAEEAEQKFSEGDFRDEKENTQDYEISCTTEEVKPIIECDGKHENAQKTLDCASCQKELDHWDEAVEMMK